MGFCEKLVLPRLLDLAMRNRRLSGYPQQAVAAAWGLVPEIGAAPAAHPSWRYGRVRHDEPVSGGRQWGFARSWLCRAWLSWRMRSGRLSAYRERAVAAARGRVLEIGAGSGLNLPLNGRAVERACAVDPSAELLRLAVLMIAAAWVPMRSFLH